MIFSAFVRMIILFVLVQAVLIVFVDNRLLAQQDENAVKAAFIYNFIGFTDWPNSQKKSDKTKICYVGDAAEVVGYLTQLSKKVPISLESKGRDSSVAGCQMLYIGFMSKADIEYIIGKTKGLPILSVSSSSEFADRGGMIGFVVAKGQVKLEANMSSIKRSKLTIDSELLELMTIYD